MFIWVLLPRAGCSFTVIKWIIDNAYKIDLSGNHTISSTFKVTNLSLFYVYLDVFGDDNELLIGKMTWDFLERAKSTTASLG